MKIGSVFFSFCLPRRKCEALSFGARLLFGFAKNFSACLRLPVPERQTGASHRQKGDGLQNKGWVVGLVYILFIWLIIILAKSRLSIKYWSHLFDSFFFRLLTF
ncbi:hypothetical protein LR021_00785, partial [Candidatus Bipolaricaulota bacterium]|nr:hypothetical protein [Candidatus Bipolaricaulota bacterium]